jgi:triosephosphate isomerase (TIM)
MRRPVIAGNWKLFKKKEEAVALVSELAPLVKNASAEVVVAPVFTVLSAVTGAVAGTGIGVAAQNCFWEEEGAYTGEVSPGMLLDAGCGYVIIGHSERRQYFGETDETVNRKIKAALKAGLTVIACVGETLAERESDRMTDVLNTQVSGALAGITADDLSRIIIAYEPVWAIGTGKTATNEQAQDAHTFIRGLVGGLLGPAAADGIRILYGGSVKPDNIRGLMEQPDIDGALVGGASLTASSFAEIVNYDK